MDLQHQKARVLVVDDDIDALNSMSGILEAEGFDTVCAHDGQEAWRLMHPVAEARIGGFGFDDA
jgi:CheY-like chemotaxis protein